MRENIFNKLKKRAGLSEINIEIPSNVHNLQLPDPCLITYYKNLNERTLWIDDEIEINSLEYVRHIIDRNREDDDRSIHVEKRTPIRLLFFSQGGDLNVNNCLVDTIQLSKTPIIGINMGMCASAACIMFLSCHTRLTLPNAQFMIHKGSGTFQGTYDELIAALMTYQQEVENMGNFILDRTTIPEEVLNEHFSTDWYLSVEEAIKYNVADRIVSSLDEIF